MHDAADQQRTQLNNKGPFNLVFYGIEPGIGRY